MSPSALRRRVLLSGTMLAAATAGYGRRAYGQCAPTVAPNYLCSGANAATQTINADNASVSTVAGFSVNTAAGNAITITGNGALSYTDTNASGLTAAAGTALYVNSAGLFSAASVTVVTNGAISGGSRGIDARNYGIDAATITANGDVTGTVNGIYARGGFDAPITLTTGAGTTVSGGTAIFARSFAGAGVLAITANGNVIGTTANGIYGRTDFAADLNVTTGVGTTVSGSNNGIFGRNSGFGAVTITANGNVTGTTANGIDAQNFSGGTTLTVTTGAGTTVSGGSRGIDARNIGSGALTVTANGNVTGTTVSASGTGIRAQNSANGTAVSVTTGAGTTVSGTTGIHAMSLGTGALTVTANGNVSGAGSGIIAVSYNVNSTALSVTTGAGTTVSGGGGGIRAHDYGAGALTITANGNVTGTNGISNGIYARNSLTGTDLSVTTGAGATVSGRSTGIIARGYGTGALTITANGNVTGTNGNGIDAQNLNSSGTDLSVTTGAGMTVSGTTGIDARNSGTGALTITVAATSTVSGTSGFGIRALNGPATVTVAGTVNGAAGGAIQFDQAGAFANRFELVTGAVINGNVFGGSGTDTLGLSGTGSGSFNVGQLVSFEAGEKTGSSIWTLTGSNAQVLSWTIRQGVLSVSADNNLGANTGALTFNGGTLRFGSSFNLANTRAVTLDGGGGTIDTNGFSTTISQAIGGLGGLTKIGAGTITLTGANNFAGGTTINAGTLALNGAGTLGATTNSTTINGGTLDIGTTSQTQGSVTLNGGNLQIAGGGALTAATIINNAGATIQNAGTVNGALGNAGTLTTTGTVAGGLTNTATVNAAGAVNGVIANNAGTFTVAGALTGNNTFTNSGTAQLDVTGGNFTGMTTLTNSSTHAAGITIAAGNTLGAATITNNAGATIQNAGTVNGALGNAGTLTTTGTVAGGLTNTATVNAAGAVNGVIANNAGIFTVTGALTGNNAFTNSGTAQLAVTSGYFTGITTLTNSSTHAAGITIAAGNTLGAATITNNAGATIVANGTITGTLTNAGTLMGIGTVGNTSIAGGTFQPGSGTAGSSMNVNGTLGLNAASTYRINLNPATASFANISGTATLGGATVNAIFANGSYIAKKYTILAAGSVSGTFGTFINTNLPANFHDTLSYDATHAYLDLILTFTTPASGTLNGNQNNVANALINSFNSNGGIPLAFSSLNANGLTQVSGEPATSSQATTFSAMNQFMGMLTDPFAGRGGGINGATSAPGFAEEEGASAYAARKRLGAERTAYAMFTKAPLAKVYEPRWSVWASGFGGSQTSDGNVAVGSSGTTSRIAGAAAGADYLLSPNTIAGFALAGGGTSFSVNGLGSGRSDLFQAGAFVRHKVGPAYISGALAYGWQDITTDRTVTVAGIDQLRARFNANAWSGRIEGGYRFVAQGFGITPYAAGQFTTFDLPAYAEQAIVGANTFALAYAAKSVTAARSELGLRGDKSFALTDGVLTLRGRAAWAHDYNVDRTIAATFQALPGASFVVNGAAQESDAALVTASAEKKWLNGWSAAGTFEGEFSGVTRSYAGKGVVRYAW